MKKAILAGSLSILIATVAYAYNITHPGLEKAFDSAAKAIQDIQAAQQNNKGIEFGGHAEKAIDLFTKAQGELVEADKYNDAHQKKPRQ